MRVQLNSDAEYQEALSKECELYQEYENLNLPKEQCRIIEQWTDALPLGMPLTLQ